MYIVPLLPGQAPGVDDEGVYTGTKLEEDVMVDVVDAAATGEDGRVDEVDEDTRDGADIVVRLLYKVDVIATVLLVDSARLLIIVVKLGKELLESTVDVKLNGARVVL